MTRLPTNVDTITVTTPKREDAADVAIRQWNATEVAGGTLRVVSKRDEIEVNPGRIVGTWRVTAQVEVVRG